VVGDGEASRAGDGFHVAVLPDSETTGFQRDQAKKCKQQAKRANVEKPRQLACHYGLRFLHSGFSEERAASRGAWVDVKPVPHSSSSRSFG